MESGRLLAMVEISGANNWRAYVSLCLKFVFQAARPDRGGGSKGAHRALFEQSAVFHHW